MKPFRKLASLLTAVVLTATLCSCGSNSESSKASSSSSLPSSLSNELSVKSCKISDDNFDKYVSNTYVTSGNNYIIKSADKITYRAYFPLEETGKLEYKFYFSNAVDSTFYDGSLAHVGMKGGDYKIISTNVYDGGTSTSSKLTQKTKVTFDSSDSKDVKSGDTFWSDAVTINIPDGHYLVWEWTLDGKNIPSCKTSNLNACYSATDGDDMSFTDTCPMPVLIGAKRDVKGRITAIGDSVTQGCVTEAMKFEYWAARISKAIGSDYSFYNCGLGWATAYDCAQCGNWLGRALNTDYMIVSLGLNDIEVGAYGDSKSSTAQQICTNLGTVLNQCKQAGCQTILFNASPFDFTGEMEQTRVALNASEKSLAASNSAKLFDFASVLCSKSDISKAVYGPHPDGKGGKAVCDEFMKQYGSLFGK